MVDLNIDYNEGQGQDFISYVKEYFPYEINARLIDGELRFRFWDGDGFYVRPSPSEDPVEVNSKGLMSFLAQSYIEDMLSFLLASIRANAREIAKRGKELISHGDFAGAEKKGEDIAIINFKAPEALISFSALLVGEVCDNYEELERGIVAQATFAGELEEPWREETSRQRENSVNILTMNKEMIERLLGSLRTKDSNN